MDSETQRLLTFTTGDSGSSPSQNSLSEGFPSEFWDQRQQKTAGSFQQIVWLNKVIHHVNKYRAEQLKHTTQINIFYLHTHIILQGQLQSFQRDTNKRCCSMFLTSSRAALQSGVWMSSVTPCRIKVLSYRDGSLSVCMFSHLKILLAAAGRANTLTITPSSFFTSWGRGYESLAHESCSICERAHKPSVQVKRRKTEIWIFHAWSGASLWETQWRCKFV